METTSYDVVVIGSGPGGEGAAMQATKLGRRVAVVERHPQIGGACTHLATIPSKALRHSIAQINEVGSHPACRAAGVSLNLSFPDLRRSARSVIERQVEMRRTFYERNRVTVIQGRARFLDPHTLEIEAPSGAKQCLTAAHFVIACGARPYRPPDVDFAHPRIVDSDTVLELSATPQSVTIYGAGIVGCEYASMFRHLGCKVNLVNAREKLLDFLDDEIIDALSYHLRDRGVIIRHQETYARVEGRDDGVILYLQSGKQLKTDLLLCANGRTGNSDTLDVAAAGVQPDSRGNLPVNANFQTSVPHVYAAGDVLGFPALASAAYMQGRAAASHIVDGYCDQLARDIRPGSTPRRRSVRWAGPNGN